MVKLNEYAFNKADGFLEEANKTEQKIHNIYYFSIVFFILLSAGIVMVLTYSIVTEIKPLRDSMISITSSGEFLEAEYSSKNEITDMVESYNQLIKTLKEMDWLKSGLNKISSVLSGIRESKIIAEEGLSFIARYVNAELGLVYKINIDDQTCELFASYSSTDKKLSAKSFKIGESAIGQVAKDQKEILLKNIAPDELSVESGIVNQIPINSIILPLIYIKKRFWAF